jgi:hypothetical protein
MAGSNRAIPWLRSRWRKPSLPLDLPNMGRGVPGISLSPCLASLMFSESWPMLYNIDSSLVYKRLIASQIRVGGQLRSGAAGRCSGFSSLKVRKISTFPASRTAWECRFAFFLWKQEARTASNG